MFLVVNNHEEIKKEAEKFFRDFLAHKPPNYQNLSIEEIRVLVPYQCSYADRDMLLREITEEDIKGVLFSMLRDKSPGPDGYTVELLREKWNIVKLDFVVVVQSFFRYGFLTKGVNTTILALIPKKKEVKYFKDYHPISLCNVLYKVISKLIANRLKKLIPSFISLNQSAFIKDRLLIENVLLASEIVKDYYKDTVTPRSAIKIDILKAFDSVNGLSSSLL